MKRLISLTEYGLLSKSIFSERCRAKRNSCMARRLSNKVLIFRRIAYLHRQ